VDLDVAQRLLDNLEEQLIVHDQDVWLIDHTTLFEIDPDDRWSCATSGCAAGFIWLEEADERSVFDTSIERVFDTLNDWRLYDSEEGEDWFDLGDRIADWAGTKLGLNSEQSCWLFYQFGDTEETINRVRFLMSNSDINEYADYVAY
jgi:hypothetical protein